MVFQLSQLSPFSQVYKSLIQPFEVYVYSPLLTDLRSSGPANHLQYLRLGVLLEHPSHVVQGGFYHHQVGREVHLEGRAELGFCMPDILQISLAKAHNHRRYLCFYPSNQENDAALKYREPRVTSICKSQCYKELLHFCNYMIILYIQPSWTQLQAIVLCPLTPIARVLVETACSGHGSNRSEGNNIHERSTKHAMV